MTDLWNTIPRAAAEGSRTELLADPKHALDFFRGRDFDGRHLFWLKVAWQGGELPKCPTIAGVDVECLQEGGHTQLTLVLRDSAQLEIFSALCSNLMEATRHLASSAGEHSIRVVIARLRHWQELLGRRRDAILTRQKIIGLVGELLVLRDHVLTRLAPAQAVLCWRGAFADEQDFVFADRIIEVKTQLATADQRLQISSEHQLDTTSGRIALVHQRLGAGAGEPSARTLNELVEEIKESIRARSPDVMDLLNMALAEVGYLSRPEYDAESWAPAGIRICEIRDDFPRLTAGDLPSGVSHVQYEVSATSCSNFEKPIEWLDRMVLG